LIEKKGMIMKNTSASFIFCIIMLYFGFNLLRIIPTLFQLILALFTRAVKWPGPRIHDTAQAASKLRERTGTGYQNLFSTFIWNIVSLTGAFVFFIFEFLSSMSFLDRFLVIKATWMEYVFAFIAFAGGILSVKLVQQNIKQVQTLLSDLAKKVEPRAVDGASAEAMYAIEHPILTIKELTSECKKAFDLYYESVRCLQDGKNIRAQTLYQEALGMDPALHKNARELLSKKLVDCTSDEEGAISYWLGVHSEYLSDRMQAKMWYEKAAEAYHKNGYKYRESRVHCNLGNVKMQMRDPSGMEEFEKAIALYPKNGTAHLNIARTYYLISDQDDDNYDKAVDAFADAIIADPIRYGPKVISSLREFGYTWEKDLEEITKRVERKRSMDRKNLE
jgi:tetratricopeptide (TPR) repeat protein